MYFIICNNYSIPCLYKHQWKFLIGDFLYNSKLQWLFLIGDILSKRLKKKQNQVQTTTFIFKILNHRHDQHSSNTCILHSYSFTTIKIVFTARNFQPNLCKNTSTL